MLRASGFQEPPEAVAQTKVCLGAFKQRADKGPQVEACSADQDRHTVASYYFSNGRFSSFGVFAGSEALSWFRYVDQVMRYATPVFKRHFGRGNSEASIDLDGIQIDDLAAHQESQLDAQFTLA